MIKMIGITENGGKVLTVLRRFYSTYLNSKVEHNTSGTDASVWVLPQ